LEPDRGKSISWLGWSFMALEHDWERAELNLKRGFELDPSTGLNYSYLLLARERPDEAIRVGLRAIERDPASPINLADMGHIYLAARRYDESIRWYRKALELNPDLGYAHTYLMSS